MTLYNFFTIPTETPDRLNDVLAELSLHNPKEYPSRKLAKMFGVSQRTIMGVIKRTAWCHLP